MEIEDEVKDDVIFAETKHDVEGHTCAAWLTGATKGDIKVSVYDADNKDNSDAFIQLVQLRLFT